MGLVSTRLQLTHRVTVQRDQNSAVGTDGWSQAPDWHDHLTDLPCRAWTDTDNGPQDEQLTAGGIRVREDRRMIVPLGTDITERDQVGDVTYRGDTILDGPMDVQAVLRYPDRLVVSLRRIR